MNVVVIEDERLTADRLIAQIKRYDASIRVLAQLSSVAESLKWFTTTPPPAVDLVFMDIHLEDGDCFQLISELPLTTPIIFTTAFDDYMLKAFKVNSVDYLLKPIHYDDLAAALNKFRQLRNSQAPTADLRALLAQLQPDTAKFKVRFMITVGTRIRSIPTGSVAYFYLEEKAVLLVTHDGTTLPVDYSLDKLAQVLDPAQFFRISRQWLVSLRAIQLVHTVGGKLRLDLQPKPKQEVVVSGDRAADFKSWLGKD